MPCLLGVGQAVGVGASALQDLGLGIGQAGCGQPGVAREGCRKREEPEQLAAADCTWESHKVPLRTLETFLDCGGFGKVIPRSPLCSYQTSRFLWIVLLPTSLGLAAVPQCEYRTALVPTQEVSSSDNRAF